MKDLTKYFIDLSKCTEEQQKHIFSLLPKDDYKIDMQIVKNYKHLHLCKIGWSVDIKPYNKTEITYPEFIKLFEGGKGEADTYAELLKNADILLNMFTELASETMTKWEQHQIDAVQFISDKISSNQ